METMFDYKDMLTRRNLLKSTLATSATAITGGLVSSATRAGAQAAPQLRGNINHSIVSWTYQLFGEKWDLPELCRHSKALGAKSVELVGPDGWQTLADAGLDCAISPNGMPGAPFVKGLNNPAYQEEVIEITRRTIEAAAKAPCRVPAVIAFTGFKWRDVDNHAAGEIDPEEGAKHTVEGLKKLAAIAEPLGIEIYLEHLNSRVENDDFRGHPGYQGDHIDYCADIIRRVGSPKVKLLFDIFHVQIMDGDIISRIREYGPDLIGHIHTAGVPGRREIDAMQENNYPAIMQALVESGYKGYVGHEFIPTRDALEGLREAIAVCDV
jgi:sugar phosphate isomerase/epimerase